MRSTTTPNNYSAATFSADRQIADAYKSPLKSSPKPKRCASLAETERNGIGMPAMSLSEPLRMSVDLPRHLYSSPIHDRRMGFMLTSDITMQLHFIDIIAIADVESDGLLLEVRAYNAMTMDSGNVTAWRNYQP